MAVVRPRSTLPFYIEEEALATRLAAFSARGEGMVWLFWPGWLDVEELQDASLGVGEAV